MELDVRCWAPRVALSEMSATIQKKAIEKFKTGETNVMIATQVIEEGLDVISCNVVLAYNMIMNIKSFIQMKGRARRLNSEFIVLRKETEKEMCENELAELKETAEIMRAIGMSEEIISPDPDAQKTFVLQEGTYEEIEETGAKVCMVSAKEYVNLYCASQSAGDKYLRAFPLYVPIQLEHVFIGVLKLPDYVRKEPIVSKQAYSSKKELYKGLAFEAIKIMVKEKKLDSHLYPINKKSAVKAKLDKIMKYLEYAQKFRHYKKEQNHLCFPQFQLYEDRALFSHRSFLPGVTMEFSLHPVEMSPGVPCGKLSSTLGVLLPPDLLPELDDFSLSAVNYGLEENLVLSQMASAEARSSPSAVVRVRLPKERRARISLTREEYQRARFFYLFMLHITNGALTLFIEAIAHGALRFGPLFDKLCPHAEEDSLILASNPGLKLDNDSARLLVLPLIHQSNPPNIDWATIALAISFVSTHMSRRSVPLSRPQQGDLLLDPRSNSPSLFLGIDPDVTASTIMKTTAEGQTETYAEHFRARYGLDLTPDKKLIKVHMLPSVKEGAVVHDDGKASAAKKHADKEKLPHGKQEGDLYFPEELCQPTGLRWETYMEYVYVPSLLAVMNEKSRFVDVAQELLKRVPGLKVSAKFVSLVERAFTCRSAQREVDYERLELLGDAIAKYLVSVNVRSRKTRL